MVKVTIALSIAKEKEFSVGTDGVCFNGGSGED